MDMKTLLPLAATLVLQGGGIVTHERADFKTIDAFGTGVATTKTRGHYTAKDPGLTTSGTVFGRTFEFRPSGNSLQDGPSGGRYAVGIVGIKANFATSTARGEVGTLYLISRQNAFGDGSAALMDVAILNKSAGGEGGFTCTFESATTEIDALTYAATRGVGVQAGVINTREEQYLGVVAVGRVGALTTAFLANAAPGASWQKFLDFAQSNRNVMQVSGDGVITLYSATGANMATLAQDGGDFVLGYGGTKRATLGYSGLTVWDQNTAWRASLQANGILSIRDAYLNFATNDPNTGIANIINTGGTLYLQTGGATTLILKSDQGVEATAYVNVYNGGGGYYVGGVKVVGARGAAVANATDAASAITQLNALLSRCRDHGLIAT